MFTYFNMLLQMDESWIRKKPDWNLPLTSWGTNLHIISFKQIFSAIVSQVTRLVLMTTWFIGMKAKFTSNRVFNDGTNSWEDHDQFSNTSHFYFKDLFKNIQEKFTIDVNVISNSVWIDVTRRRDVWWQIYR